MLRRLMIVCIAATATTGVALARPHQASAQGAVLCGIIHLPVAAATGVHRFDDVSSSGELPCSSLIVTEPTPPPGSRVRGSQIGTVVHCTYDYSVTLTPIGSDPSVVTGTGQLRVNWSDGGESFINVTVVGAVSSAGISALEMVGPVFGRFNGGIASFTDGLVAGTPVQQLAVAWT